MNVISSKMEISSKKLKVILMRGLNNNPRANIFCVILLRLRVRMERLLVTGKAD